MIDFREIAWAQVAAPRPALAAAQLADASVACRFDIHYTHHVTERLACTHGDWIRGWADGLAGDTPTHRAFTAILVAATHGPIQASRPRQPALLDPAHRSAFDDVIVAHALAWPAWLDDVAREIATLAATEPGQPLADHLAYAVPHLVGGAVTTIGAVGAAAYTTR